MVIRCFFWISVIIYFRWKEVACKTCLSCKITSSALMSFLFRRLKGHNLLWNPTSVFAVSFVLNSRISKRKQLLKLALNDDYITPTDMLEIISQSETIHYPHSIDRTVGLASVVERILTIVNFCRVTLSVIWFNGLLNWTTHAAGFTCIMSWLYMLSVLSNSIQLNDRKEMKFWSPPPPWKHWTSIKHLHNALLNETISKRLILYDFGRGFKI